MVMRLARSRAYPGARLYTDYEPQPRKDGRTTFWASEEYYRIIDRISRGEKP